MNRPKSRRDVLISTTTSPALISLLTFPQPAQAAAKDESMNYQAVWFDPQHPIGYRILYGDDQSATLLLKDTPEDNELILPVKVIKEGKDTKLLFDFSKLGLSNVEQGTLTRRKSDKVRIISFDNGNNEWINKKVRHHRVLCLMFSVHKYILKLYISLIISRVLAYDMQFESPIGVWKDSTNSKRVIIIRQVNNNKGSDCIVDFRDGQGKVTSFTGTAGTTFTFINFPGKDNEVVAAAKLNMFKRTLTFDDGTVWTKY